MSHCMLKTPASRSTEEINADIVHHKAKQIQTIEMRLLCAKNYQEKFEE